MDLTLKIPANHQEIKQEVDRLRGEIRIKEAEVNLLKEMVKHYQRHCSHPGQKTGHNERDGSWGSPCPVCGHAY